MEVTDKEMEAAAREMARCRGFDPDALCHRGAPMMIGDLGYGAPGKPAPTWHLFAHDARAAISALDAFRAEKAK